MRHLCKLLKYFIVIMFLITTVCNVLFAQNDTAKIFLKKPMLNGHIFSSSNTTKSAFVNTFLNSEFGVGNTGLLELPGIKIGDNEFLSFTGYVTFFNVNINYQQKINDWLALKIDMSMGGRLGTSLPTILVDGLNTYSGRSIGWNFRFINKPKLQMTGNVFVKNIYGNFIDIIGYVNEIIDDVPNASAFKTIPVLNTGIGTQGAWAFNKTYGLQFGTEVSYGESFNRGSESFFSSTNIAADMDLMPKKHIPVGFALGYMFSSNPEDTYLEFIYTNIYSGKISYTGSSDFDIGFLFIMNEVKLSYTSEEKPMIYKAQLYFKLFF